MGHARGTHAATTQRLTRTGGPLTTYKTYDVYVPTEPKHLDPKYIPASTFRTSLAEHLDDVQHASAAYVLTRHGKRSAAVIPVDALDRLAAAERADNGLAASDPSRTRNQLAAGLADTGFELDATTTYLAACEAAAVAGLLDELAETYPGEPLGTLAAEWSARINRRATGATS